MAIKKIKPTTNGQRFKSVNTFKDITKKEPEKRLTKIIRKRGGRNNKGHITIRHRGGGSQRKYRRIDFKRDKRHIEAKVKSIEYDPNRSANIALLQYQDGEKRYILAPDGLQVGQTVIAGDEVLPQLGNALPLERIPSGTFVHNIEIVPGKGGQIARSAGAAAQIMAKEGKYVTLAMPSSEVRLIAKRCYATVGEVGNKDHENVTAGKAGVTRHKGRRPKVRGVVMNPVDHPMGGGEGRTSGGGHPRTPWGKPTKGYKTRKKHKRSERFIVKRRSK